MRSSWQQHAKFPREQGPKLAQLGGKTAELVTATRPSNRVALFTHGRTSSMNEARIFLVLAKRLHRKSPKVGGGDRDTEI